MARPIKVYDADGEFIRMTDAQIGYDFSVTEKSVLFDEMTTRMSTSLYTTNNANITGQLFWTLTVPTGEYLNIGSYEDSYRTSAVNTTDTGLSSDTKYFQQSMVMV